MIATIMLENVFGLHNLTSDAEGEEMLTVSRKVVQEEYRESINKAHPYNINSYNRGFHVGCATMLKELFGSKCLPDACNVASNVASKEPKPAEPKFNVGDEASYVCSPTLKYKCTVTKIMQNEHSGKWEYNVLFEWGKPGMWIPESDLEPYAEPTAKKIGNPDISNASKSVPLESDSTDHVGKSNETVDRDHNRLRIEAMAMQGLLSNPSWTVTKVCRAKEVAGDDSDKAAAILIKDIAEDAVEFTDALIEQCEKGDKS